MTKQKQFPRWDWFVPTVGLIHSQCGTKMVPAWEYVLWCNISCCRNLVFFFYIVEEPILSIRSFQLYCSKSAISLYSGATEISGTGF